MKNDNILTILPAAGRGSRMLSLTDNCPKSMIPIAGKPLISYILDQFIENGLKDVTIVVGYKKESLIDYVNTFYSSKLNVMFIEQTELLGLGHAIYKVLDSVDINKYKSVFIMLGDAIFDNNCTEKLFNFNKSYVACMEMPDYSRWCIANVYNNGYIANLLDKPKQKPEKNNALIGAYFFENIEYFKHCIDESISSNIKINNEFQISTAIELYNKFEKIEARFFNNGSWYDFGDLDVYNVNRRKFNSCRFFNNLRYTDESTIIKTSNTNHVKIQREINWYLALPENLKKYTPKLCSYSLDDCNTNYAVEYCNGNTLQELWLYSNLSIEVWENILNKINEINEDFSKSSGSMRIDFSKFLKKQISNRVDIDEFFKGNYENINGVVYDLNSLKEFFVKYLNNYNASMMTAKICHGDMVFSNIIYDVTNRSIKLIDPRGDFNGNILYGPAIYDLAKLAQCVIGDYDYIVNDMFVFTEDGYKIFMGKDNSFKETLFDIIAKNNINKEYILFVTAVQFMTMIPLHAENKNHQKMMRYKAIEILGKLQEMINN